MESNREMVEHWSCNLNFLYAVILILVISPFLFTGCGKKEQDIDCSGMVLVPDGWFTQGSGYGDPDERPVRRVWLDAYYIDKCEVTIGAYQDFIEATGHRPLPGWVEQFAPTENHPVVGVSWKDANAYCTWAGKQLPTEAQWEKAARGEHTYSYPWGDDKLYERRSILGELQRIPVVRRISWVKDRARANFCDANCNTFWAFERVNDGYAFTAPVGSYPDGKSPYGAYDMLGNVWEWTKDNYDSTYYARRHVRNPFNARRANSRVIRGAGWRDDANVLRVTDRRSLSPDSTIDRVGFRCVMQMLPATTR